MAIEFTECIALLQLRLRSRRSRYDFIDNDPFAFRPILAGLKGPRSNPEITADDSSLLQETLDRHLHGV